MQVDKLLLFLRSLVFNLKIAVIRRFYGIFEYLFQNAITVIPQV